MSLRFETLQLHAGQEIPDPTTGARAVPIYQSAAYVFPNAESAEARFALKEAGNIYGRLTNPTQSAFEQRISKLEGGSGAIALASGSSAIAYSIQNIARAGDHIVASSDIYGGTYNLFANTFKDYGIEATFVDVSNLDELNNAIKENTKAVFVETLTNPHSKIIDIESIANIAHKNDIPLIVDNTFATPFLIRPIEYGADIIVHSATKYIGGHGTSLGGVVIESGKFNWEKTNKFPTLVEPTESYHGVSFSKACGDTAFVTRIRAVLLRDLGATLSPFHAFLFLQGLETLSLRIERHIYNALKVADFLSKHGNVVKVNHPAFTDDKIQQELYEKYYKNGAGAIFTFEINGDENTAKAFIDKLELFSLVANVADVKSLVIHPASTTHSQLSKEKLEQQEIYGNTIRLSIGTEHIDDIIEDLAQALK
ncbi:MAG: O-acetylhomoserine aminocarboxypropyltransferase/cysteine synthase family protein [Clostridia bacterium]